MSCANCGSPEVYCVDSKGGTERDAHFEELYECNHCGARGTVRGKNGVSPQKWSRVGSVFGGNHE